MKGKLFKLIGLVVVGAGVLACQSNPTVKPTTANAAEALSQAGSLATMGERVAFLINETKGFLDAQQYDDAARLAEHILELEPANEEARRLARKAYEKTMGNMVGN